MQKLPVIYMDKLSIKGLALGIGVPWAFVLYRISRVYGAIIVVVGIITLVFLRLVPGRFAYIVGKDIKSGIKRLE